MIKIKHKRHKDDKSNTAAECLLEMRSAYTIKNKRGRGERYLMLTGLSTRPQRELTKNKIKPCAASADCLPNKAKRHTHSSTGNADKIRNSLKESKQKHRSVRLLLLPPLPVVVAVLFVV